jgi:hypothetical protein
MWLFGREASGNIADLALTFRELRGREANQAQNRTDAYTPWVGLLGASVGGVQAPELLAPRCQRGALIVDEAFLSVLREAYRDGENPMGAIMPQDTASEVVVKHDEMSKAAEMIADACGLITAACPVQGEQLGTLIDYFVPISHRRNGRPHKRCFSNHVVFGAIHLTIEPRSFDTELGTLDAAVDISHELGHHVLSLYQHCDPIIESDPQAPCFSAVRGVERPAIQAMHAAVALGFMTDFCARVVRIPTISPEAVSEIDRCRASYSDGLGHTLSALHSTSVMSPLGRAMVEELWIRQRTPTTSTAPE